MAEGFSSELDTAQDRFLSLVIQHGLAEAWLTPADIVGEFPPEAIMGALEGAPALRARILVEAAGVHEKIAPKKSTSAAAEDLKLALDEGVCSPEDLIALFPADDQVRYLDPAELWAFLTREEFHKQAGEQERQRVLFLLQTALDQELLDLGKLISEVGPETLASELPKEVLQKVFVLATTSGLDGQVFDAAALVEAVPLADWVEHVPLAQLWDSAVVEIASLAGLLPGAAQGQRKSKKKKRKSDKESSAVDVSDLVEDVEVEVLDGPAGPSSPSISVAPASDRSREEIVARDRALVNLRHLDREPKNPEALSTPLLLAIDAMYAELMTLTEDEARAECIRDAFPSEKLLIEGLFSLAESLDPNLDANALRKKEPDVEALIQLVLFEERRRDSGHPSRGSSPPPQVQGPGDLSGPSVSPPPLPPPSPPKG